MSFRNRCLIAGANGIIALSIPLQQGRNQRTPIHEVKIDVLQPWQAQHWKSIQSAYNRSPFFDHYRDELESLYSSKVENLMEWNLECLEWIRRKIDWPVEIHLTESRDQESDPGKWEDRRNLILPKNYAQYEALTYRQVFEEKTGFFNNLSVLDLLFNTGRAAWDLLNT